MRAGPGVAQQQAKDVAIAVNVTGADLLLLDQALGEEAARRIGKVVGALMATPRVGDSAPWAGQGELEQFRGNREVPEGIGDFQMPQIGR